MVKTWVLDDIVNREQENALATRSRRSDESTT